MRGAGAMVTPTPYLARVAVYGATYAVGVLAGMATLAHDGLWWLIAIGLMLLLGVIWQTRDEPLSTLGTEEMPWHDPSPAMLGQRVTHHDYQTQELWTGRCVDVLHGAIRVAWERKEPKPRPSWVGDMWPGERSVAEPDRRVWQMVYEEA